MNKLKHGILSNGIAKVLITYDNGFSTTHHGKSLKDIYDGLVDVCMGRKSKCFDDEIRAFYKNIRSFTAQCGEQTLTFERSSR